jgi:anaerobic ribonucleoside-triphosphate reductase activating protein
VTCAAQPLYSEDEILKFLSSRKGILDGVCVTGGEPLLQKDLDSFLAKVKEMGVSVKLDTNGSFPHLLRPLVEQGLVDYVAMDVKNRPEKYAATVGVPGFEIAPLRESISYIMEGRIPYEFRTTVVRQLHTPEDIAALTQWIRGAEKYALQSFVDSGAVLTEGLSAWDKETVYRMAEIAREAVPNTEVRGI